MIYVNKSIPVPQPHASLSLTGKGRVSVEHEPPNKLMQSAGFPGG